MPLTALAIAALALGAVCMFAVVALIAAAAAGGAVRENAPGPLARLWISLSSRGVSTRAGHRLPELCQRRHRVTPETLFDIASLACRTLGWRVERQSSDTLRLEATARAGSLPQPFRPSVQICIMAQPAGSGATLVATATHQFALPDLGFGAGCVEALLDHVDARIAGEDTFPLPMTPPEPAVAVATRMPTHV